jgi:hypothetical protein
MNAVEFQTEPSGETTLAISPAVLAKLPKTGTARIIILTRKQTDDEEWQAAAYAQFIRDDSPEDVIYESLR